MPEQPVDVVISGAGPNGLMLAAELCLAGVRPLVLERAAEISDEPRANGLVGQVVEMLHMRGLFAALSGEEGPPRPELSCFFGGFVLPLDGVADHKVHALPIAQPRLTRLLADHARALGAEIRWGHALAGFEQRDGRVLVSVEGPDGAYEIDCGWLVGADGGRSLVRKTLGIAFPGHVSAIVGRMGHVALPPSLLADGGILVPGAGFLAFGYHRRGNGMIAFRPTEPGLLAITTEFAPDHDADAAPMTFEELRESIRRMLGADLPVAPPAGPGPFALRRTDGQQTRLAERYRDGHVFLLGDSAHVHTAMGGPGLNLGLQDAVNLGWKLAARIRGEAPDALLDSYQSERYPVAERVVMHTLAQMALIRPGPEMTALGALFGELLQNPDAVAHVADLIAGVDLAYEVDGAHAMCGKMVRDFPLVVDGEQGSLFERLRTARPVLLDLTPDQRFRAIGALWGNRLDCLEAAAPDVPVPALFVRPDGYVAWVAEGRPGEDEQSLHRALTRWLGPVSPVTEGKAARVISGTVY